MESWKIFLIVAVIAAIAVYALNSLSDQVRQEKDISQQDYINKTINSKFDENFARQNFLGNVTVAPVLDINKQIKEMLENRSVKFDAIIENERTIINNQYKFAQQLNVTGVSNETR